jgi:hypothetical protein
MVGRLDEGCLLLVLLNMVIHQILPKLDHELCGMCFVKALLGWISPFGERGRGTPNLMAFHNILICTLLECIHKCVISFLKIRPLKYKN